MKKSSLGFFGKVVVHIKWFLIFAVAAVVAEAILCGLIYLATLALEYFVENGSGVRELRQYSSFVRPFMYFHRFLIIAYGYLAPIPCYFGMIACPFGAIYAAGLFAQDECERR